MRVLGVDEVADSWEEGGVGGCVGCYVSEGGGPGCDCCGVWGWGLVVFLGDGVGGWWGGGGGWVLDGLRLCGWRWVLGLWVECLWVGGGDERERWVVG